MGKYADWLPSKGSTTRPGWLLNTNGKALGRQTGMVLDTLNDMLLQGLLARFPTKGNANANGAFGAPPTDALDEQATDRGLRRGPSEADAALGPRVQRAWDDWVFAGSHYGVLRQLKIAGYLNAVSVQDNGRYARLTGSAGDITDLSFGTLMTCNDRTGTPHGWTLDTRRGAYWSQWMLLFTADATNLQDTGGQSILNSIALAWGPGDAAFRGSAVIVAGKVWGWPTTTKWGAASLKWGGNTVRYIPPDGSPPITT